MPSRYGPTAPLAPAQRAARPLELPLEPRCTFYMRQLSYAEQMRPARGRGWIVVVHWGLVQLGRHGQARCALRLRPRAATTVRPEQFRPWVHTWNVLRPRARVLLWSLSGATGQLSGASACRRALGPRRAAGAAGKGGACCGGSGAWRRSSPTSAARLASRSAQVAAQAQRRCELPLGRRLARSRPPPPPGGGSRRQRRLRGRRHLPHRHLFSLVDRCGRTSHAAHTPVTSPTPPRV